MSQTIVGNREIHQQLWRLIEAGRIPHAQLLTGASGIGLLNTASAMTEKILGLDSQKQRVLQHPDVHFFFPTATNSSVKSKPRSALFLVLFRQFVRENPYGTLYEWYEYLDIENKQGQIGVEDAQDILRKTTLKNFEGAYKVIIIWHAEKMNLSAANKLLKILEEPSEKIIFLLLTTQADEILPTILSRLQHIELNKISDQEIVNYLKTNHSTDEQEAQAIAFKARGSLQRALQIVGKQHDGTFEQYFIQWVRYSFMAKKQPAVLRNLVQWSEEIGGWGREKQKQFLVYSIEIFRQALLSNYRMEQLVVNEIQRESFDWKAFSSYIHGANITCILEELNRALYHIERNVSAKMIFLDTSIKITRFLHKKVNK